jgi:acyl carrier protein
MMDETIRLVLAEHGRLAVDVNAIDERTDLFASGMTSHASVNVMLALEDAFDIEFAESMLRKSTFESIAAIRAGVSLMQAACPPRFGSPGGPEARARGVTGSRRRWRSAVSARPPNLMLQTFPEAVDEQAWLPCVPTRRYAQPGELRTSISCGPGRSQLGIPVVE